jgi:uncharacterized protein YqgQ
MNKEFLNYRDFLSLNESKASAKRRFLNTNKIDKETFDEFVKMDPSPNFKYVEKLIEFHLKDKVEPFELSSAIETYHELENRNLINADIQRLSYEEFDSLITQALKRKKEIDKEKKETSEVEVILDNDDFLIIVPQTIESSCKYGSGTRWCTAAKKDNYFKSYVYNQGVTLYYIIDKNRSHSKTYSKIAVAVYEDERRLVYNANDTEIGMHYVMNELGLDENIFMPRELTSPQAQLHRTLTKYGINEDKLTDNGDGTYDYDGSINLFRRNLNSLLDIGIRFRKITENFNCSNNKLENLEGSPEIVEGIFDCSYNNLPSLVDGPKQVGREYDCSYNPLKTLEGIPVKVGDLDCQNTEIINLLHCPQEVGDLYLSNNKYLTSLKGGPEIVDGDLTVGFTKIEKFEDIKKVNGSLFAQRTKLKTLKEIPLVKGNIILFGNQLTSIEGLQKEITGMLDISYNEIEKLDFLPKARRINVEENPGDLEEQIKELRKSSVNI